MNTALHEVAEIKARVPAPERTIVPAAPGELRRIPLRELIESPWNPRRHFDPVKLAETAESLRTNGQLTPIIVRPIAGKHERFEIGAGHRRFRAAPQAGLDTLLAVVRDLDDVAFLELLTIENKQREDVEPLDEAAGFKLLMEKAGYDVQKLADRIGLSKEYVYGRLKLLQLIPELKQYLEDKVITAGHGVLLARLTPADQKRVMGSPSRMNRYGYSDGTGLFQPDHADHDPNQPALDLKQPIKARSVRELATYINDHVRFKPDENDLPNLFPAAAAAIAEAKGDDLQPVYITYDHQLKFEAKDPKVRTYGVMSWRRADGQQKSKTCAWSRIGIVAAGRHRGDAFRVCVNRDKCEVHFKAARQQAKRRVADRARYASDDAGESSWEKAEALRQARRKAIGARWKKATPALLTALATALKKLSGGMSSPLGRFIWDDADFVPRVRDADKYLTAGKTADDLLRYIALLYIASDLDDPWDEGKEATRKLKLFGINAKQVLAAVAPEPQPEKKPTTKPAKKGGR